MSLQEKYTYPHYRDEETELAQGKDKVGYTSKLQILHSFHQLARSLRFHDCWLWIIMGQYIHCFFYQCGTPGSHGIVSPVSVFPGPTCRVWFLAHSLNYSPLEMLIFFPTKLIDHQALTPFSLATGVHLTQGRRERCNLLFSSPPHPPPTSVLPREGSVADTMREVERWYLVTWRTGADNSLGKAHHLDCFPPFHPLLPV